MAARSVEEILQLLDDKQAVETVLASLNNPSQTAEFELWKYVFAQIQNFDEQLWDELAAEINEAIALAAPATPAWIKDKVEKFQYSATNPQVLQMINFAPSYPTVDETLRIISRCAVKTLGNNTVQIKVLKNDPPVVLATLEANSLAGYIAQLIPAGVSFQLINVAPDKLYIAADIYYDGQYATTIEDEVKAAINAYIAALPPDGIIEVSELQNAINDTVGVKDVKITTIKARQDSIAFASATVVYDLPTGTNLRFWPTFSASIVEETTAGQTFTDTLNFIASS